MKGVAGLVAGTGILWVSAAGVTASIENPDLREYYHLGSYYAETGQPEKAIVNYRAMIAKYPDTREAERGWLHIGQANFALMRSAMAERDKTRARPGATKGEIQSAEALVASFLNEAVAAYRKVIAQFPNARAEAMIGVGQTFAAVGADKADEARAQFTAVVDGYPEEAGRALLLAGDMELALGNTDAARKAYRTASLAYPENASLAALKLGGLDFDAGQFGEASESYDDIVRTLGIDGAYDDIYHLLGGLMKEALQKRGEAERALKNKDAELEGYTALVSRFAGTSVGMEAKAALARALWYYGRGDEGTALLRGMTSDYPKSVWAVRGLFALAELQSATPDAAETLKKIVSAWPQSRFRIEAQMKLADTYLKLADARPTGEEQDKLRAQAREACNAILADYPRCPEADRARAFIVSHRL